MKKRNIFIALLISCAGFVTYPGFTQIPHAEPVRRAPIEHIERAEEENNAANSAKKKHSEEGEEDGAASRTIGSPRITDRATIAWLKNKFFYSRAISELKKSGLTEDLQAKADNYLSGRKNSDVNSKLQEEIVNQLSKSNQALFYLMTKELAAGKKKYAAIYFNICLENARKKPEEHEQLDRLLNVLNDPTDPVLSARMRFAASFAAAPNAKGTCAIVPLLIANNASKPHRPSIEAETNMPSISVFAYAQKPVAADIQPTVGRSTVLVDVTEMDFAGPIPTTPLPQLTYENNLKEHLHNATAASGTNGSINGDSLSPTVLVKLPMRQQTAKLLALNNCYIIKYMPPTPQKGQGGKNRRLLIKYYAVKP